MKDTEVIKTYDDIKREITTRLYIIDHGGLKKALVWEGKEPYPMSHHIEGETEWQDSKDVEKNTQ